MKNEEFAAALPGQDASCREASLPDSVATDRQEEINVDERSEEPKRGSKFFILHSSFFILKNSETQAMRGLAILGIVLHNYCHFIGKIVKENEYQYLEMNNDRLWHVLTHPDALLPVHLLSYFGHYGVPVFLFLSGYGLVRKYEGSSETVASLPFLRYHYLKLLRMLIVGFSMFLVVDAVTPGRFAFEWEHVAAQLLMVINVLPEPDRIIWPGIYWFFGLMMELYLVYRLLLYRRSNWLAVGLMLVCWLLQAVCLPDGETLNRLRYNCIGGMLPFVMGILEGRGKRGEVREYSEASSSAERRADAAYRSDLLPLTSYLSPLKFFSLLILPLIVFCLCLNFQTWLWVPAIVVLATVMLVKSMPAVVLRLFVWLGSISAAMFVAHPIARKLFITVAWKQDIYDGLMLYVIGTIALSWAVKQIIDRLPKPSL